MKSIGMIIVVTLVVFAGNLKAEECKGERKSGPCMSGMRGRHGMRGDIRSRVRKHITEALELTEEQKEQAKAIREANEEKMKKYGEALRDAHKAMREASTADQIDEKAVRDLAQNIADAMAEMALLRAEMKKSFEAILTEEQKAKLEEKKAEVKERMGMMKKRFEERRGGCKKDCDKK